jgi:hypothetical protein
VSFRVFGWPVQGKGSLQDISFRVKTWKMSAVPKYRCGLLFVFYFFVLWRGNLVNPGGISVKNQCHHSENFKWWICQWQFSRSLGYRDNTYVRHEYVHNITKSSSFSPAPFEDYGWQLIDFSFPRYAFVVGILPLFIGTRLKFFDTAQVSWHRQRNVQRSPLFTYL